MSTPRELSSPAIAVPSARARRAIDAAAAQWVVRERAGLDGDAERELARWREADPAHEAAYARLAGMSGVFDRMREQGGARTIATQLQVRARRRRARRRTLAGAVAAAIALLAGAWGLRTKSEVAAIQAAPLAVRAPEPIRRLPDGSIVELNRESEIKVAFDDAIRRVELVRGEALFRVEKDSARPFVVRAAGVEVRAVGTAFNVRLGPAAIEVLVTEGKVGISETKAGKSLLPADATAAREVPVLTAGHRARVVSIAASGDLALAEISAIAPDELKTQLAWRIPRLEFDAVALAAAAAEINRHNRVQVILADESTKALRISGAFFADDPHAFARLVAATLGLRVTQRSEAEIVLAAAPVAP